jgi:enterochelin esterase-like enzyme
MMLKKSFFSAISLLLLLLASSCKSKIKQQEDEIYSRHLQRQVKLTIISTPIPDDKGELNLLLLNDGQDMGKLKLQEIVDSLYKNKLIQPLIIVGITAGDRMKEFGVSGMPDFMKRGDKADNYAAFIDNELYAFAKKKAGVRKFKSVVLAGFSLGGLSAFDIAWDHADKIDKVGVFSGSFWWRDKDNKAADYSDDKNRIIINKIRSSRKKPHLQYWFYAGAAEETGDRDKDGITDVVDDTKDLVELIKSKNVCLPEDVVYTEAADGKHDQASWSKQLPAFLIWAFSK